MARPWGSRAGRLLRMPRRQQTLGVFAPAFSRLSFINFLSLSRVSHHEARLLSDPLVRRSRQLQCRRRRIIPLVADDLETTSRNRLSYRTFVQVIFIIPWSCRLFSAARAGVVLGGIVPEPDCSANDCSSRTFPQVGSVAEQCQRLLRAQGWYCDFVPFPDMEKNR